MAHVTHEFLAEMPRPVQADIGDLKLDVREIRTHVEHIEVRVASLSTRMDRRDEMTDPVMRRLDLLDDHHAPSP